MNRAILFSMLYASYLNAFFLTAEFAETVEMKKV
jgi:hypothetical protein